MKAYQNCLSLNPFHEEAQNSIEFLNTKQTTSSSKVSDTEVTIPGLNSVRTSEVKDTLKDLLKNEEEEKKEKSKSKKKKERK